MSIEIAVKGGKFAIVDEEDAGKVADRRWWLLKCPHLLYARTKVEGKSVPMHHIILDIVGQGKRVDHINGNGLDNRKCNLRLVTPQQNSWNRRKNVKSKSKYKGVYFMPSKGKWRAYIYREGNKWDHLGYFMTEVEAAKAYNIAATERRGEYANLNIIEEG